MYSTPPPHSIRVPGINCIYKQDCLLIESEQWYAITTTEAFIACKIGKFFHFFIKDYFREVVIDLHFALFGKLNFSNILFLKKNSSLSHPEKHESLKFQDEK